MFAVPGAAGLSLSHLPCVAQHTLLPEYDLNMVFAGRNNWGCSEGDGVVAAGYPGAGLAYCHDWNPDRHSMGYLRLLQSLRGTVSSSHPSLLLILSSALPLLYNQPANQSIKQSVSRLLLSLRLIYVMPLIITCITC